jgi:hypothetical protein
MGYMKKYKCPHCLETSQVIRKTKRGNSIRYFCKKCLKYFSVNACWFNKRLILNDHLDGLSFRKLSVKYKISKSKAWKICDEQLRSLPNNNQFTYNYCNRFSQVFLFDGKYFNVATDKYDWVLLWGVDYFKHDIPVFTIAPSENYQSWAKCLSYFRILQCFPKLVVCDDNVNLKLAVKSRFPGCRIQTCFNHFKENIRRDLKVRSDKTNQYRGFMRRIERVLDSSNKLSDENFNNWLWSLYRDFRNDPVARSVLINIEKYKQELLGYRGIPQAPLTTNLIEGLNGHLEARLQSLRSFQSVEYARLWLNGYVLKRRFTKFTDCRLKFRYLRGKRGVDQTKKERVNLPLLF